jgi:hypothetical protein
MTARFQKITASFMLDAIITRKNPKKIFKKPVKHPQKPSKNSQKTPKKMIEKETHNT